MSNRAPLPAAALRPVAGPGRVGQGTATEQSRAMTEVLAAVQVAQACPRDEELALAALRHACAQDALAQRAFYRTPRAGTTVNGPSVYLARELARIWGNVDYGFGELRRDDEAGQSEIRAWAWDQQTNTRSSSTFIVPHKRDKKGGPVPLTELRDIYLNNASEAARRVREAIFAVLPDELIEEAKDICQATLDAGGGKPLEERRQAAVDAFAELGVTVDQLERKLLRPLAQWDGRDLGHLTTIRNSIRRGELDPDDEFEARRVDTAEIERQAEQDAADPPAAPAGEQPADAPAEDPAAADVEPWDRPPPGPAPAAASEPPAADPDPADDLEQVTLPQLLDALRASGRIPPKAPNGPARTALLAAAAELCGVTVGVAEDVTGDQALAAQLLAKLTPAAES